MFMFEGEFALDVVQQIGKEVSVMLAQAKAYQMAEWKNDGVVVDKET